MIMLLLMASEVGSGNQITQVHTATDFTAVQTRGPLDIEITEGDAFKVEVTIDDNLQPFIVTQVKDKVLHIEQTKSLDWKGKARVSIAMPKLLRAASSGSGDIRIRLRAPHELEVSSSGSGDVSLTGPVTALNVQLAGSGDGHFTLNGAATSLVLQTRGSGDVMLSGATKILDASTSGSGTISAEKLSAAKAALRTSGSGDIVVTVTEEVTSAMTSGSGDITFYGKPNVLAQHRSGSGTIRRL